MGFRGIYLVKDIDGDGDMDMLVGDEEGRLHLFTNQVGQESSRIFVPTHPNYFDMTLASQPKPQLVDAE